MAVVGIANWGWKYGYVNTTGSLVIPCNYDHAGSFHEGLDGMAIVSLGGKCLFINKLEQLVFNCDYNPQDLIFYEGIMRVAIPDGPFASFGFMNKSGQLVIPCEYVSADRFSEGLARVRLWEYGFGYGYINKSGQLVVPCVYNDADTYFSGGLAKVSVYEYGYGFKYGYIDTAGREIIPCVFDQIQKISDTVFWVKQNNLWGIMEMQEHNFALTTRPAKTSSGYNIPITVTNNDINNQTKTVIAAIYNDNTLIGINKAVVSIPASGTPKNAETINLDIITEKTGTILKLFVWDNYGQMNPYDTSVVLPFN
jgi:hypothetical protein